MGNSSSSENCAKTSTLDSLTTEVQTLQSSIPSSFTASVTTTDGGAATSSQDMTNGWVQKVKAMSASQSKPTENQAGADQVCPTGQVVCGISFVHTSGDNYSFQEWYKLKCCKPEVSVDANTA